MATFSSISFRCGLLGALAGVAVSACGQAAPQSATTAPISHNSPSPTADPANVRLSLPAFQAGVILYAASNDAALQASFPRMLDRLAGIKVNTIAFAFPLYQSSWTSTDVHADETKTPSPTVLRRFVQEAHRRSISVVIRPLIDDAPLAQSGHWRGVLAPTSREAWFASYKAVLLSYATTAESAGAEVLDIGTELSSLQTSAPAWEDLVTSLRSVFHGQLTYSSNWDVAYPAFAGALDFASVDGFYPLSAPNGASVAQLVDAWKQWTAKLTALQTSLGKPVVLTELGTTSEVGSYRSPFSWQHGTGLSLEAQRRYYAASCQALKPIVHGMYWWAYYPWVDPATSANDAGYTPMGKPAEAEITNCYG